MTKNTPIETLSAARCAAQRDHTGSDIFSPTYLILAGLGGAQVCNVDGVGDDLATDVLLQGPQLINILALGAQLEAVLGNLRLQTIDVVLQRHDVGDEALLKSDDGVGDVGGGTLRVVVLGLLGREARLKAGQCLVGVIHIDGHVAHGNLCRGYISHVSGGAIFA